MCVAQADVSLPPRREGVTPMATSATNVGQNVKVTQTAKKITIEIDTTKEFGKSKSGKTISIASTRGNAKLENGLVMGLNLYKYPED
jgi:hypothetical protein